MSQENLELVRRSWTAFADGGLDVPEELCGEEIDWRAIEAVGLAQQ